MINVQSLSKSYGSQLLFNEISFQMNPGERLGLVGRNGHGKSTLFRIILGEEEADEGQVTLPRNYRIGHLAQHLNFTEPTILEEACLGLSADESDDHYKVERVLFGLGFGHEDMYRAPQEFSGGFQVRLNLAKLLVSNPNLLLLDEPTNYLDIISIRWIIRFLRQWRGELILISHDRDFMDQVTTHTAAIHRHKIRRIQGNTEKLYSQILQEEEIHEKTRVNEEKKRKQVESFITRFRAQASKASSVQSRVKQLEKMPSLEKLANIDELDFSFRSVPFAADILLKAENVSFHYEPENPLIQDFSLTLKAGERIAIIGKNGRGKTTLLNLLAGETKPAEGTITSHSEMKLGYFGQTNIQRLHPQLTIEEEILSVNPNLGKTAVRNICGTMMFSGDKAEKKISVLSGGEKSRVMLGKILAQPSNLLFLDEPTNHLDMESIEALVESIQDFSGSVVIVTHSELILRALATKLIVFQHGKIETFDGTYDEFLERIGWEGEATKKNNTAISQSKSKSNKQEPKRDSDSKEQRRMKAESINERSRLLTPLKKEIEKQENEIQKLEQELAQVNQKLIQASTEQKVEELTRLSKIVKDLQQKIQMTYYQLELATEKYEQEEAALS